VREDNALWIPANHRFDGEFQGRLRECHAHITRHLPIRILHVRETGQTAHPHAELVALKNLDQVGQNQSPRGTVKQYDFRHMAADDRQGGDLTIPR